MSAHTPGPWIINENTTRTRNGSWFEIDGLMTRIADVPASTNSMWDFAPGYGAGHANARLIAAAPELLSEFKQVMSWIENWSPEFSNDPDWPKDRDKALAAIAKATGQ